MERPLLFHQFYLDSLQVLAGETTYSFFKDNEEDEESVTSLIEEKAIQWLFRNHEFNHRFKSLLFEEPQHVQYALGLVEPFTKNNVRPGDIDVILVKPNLPHQIIALECKRVKVVSVDANTSKVNGARNIQHGVKQANSYQSLGFYQSYLVVIILDDARKLEVPNVMLRRGNSAEVLQVFDIPLNEPMHEDVGVAYIRITQPTGKSFNYSAGVGICIDKPARPLEQPRSLTEKMLEHLRTNPHLYQI